MSQGQQMDIAAQGFGQYDDWRANTIGTPSPSTEDDDERKSYRLEDNDQSGYVANYRYVQFKPLLGLFNQEQLLLLRYLPMQIELVLLNNASGCVNVSGVYTASWNVSDVQCKCDLLDSSLQDEYASNIISGKSLLINFSSWKHINQATNNDKDFSVHVSRSLTRLKSVFITLKDNMANDRWKTCNDFSHPIARIPTQQREGPDEHQSWIQIGSKLLPEYPISGGSEAFNQLRKTVGTPIHIHQRWYRTRKYIIGFDCEKISGAGFTGVNTKAGNTLTINFRGCSTDTGDTDTGDAPSNNIPERIYVGLHYDAVLNIKDYGVEVLE